MNFFSPLEQFEIIPLVHINGLFDITNSAIYISLVFLVIFLLAYISISKAYLIPGRWQIIAENFYTFVVDMVKQQAGSKAYAFFPLFITTFFIILMSNLLGLTPFGFTVTGHIIVTFSLALAFNLGFVFLGLYLHKLHFFSLFVPSGVPKVLIPLIVVIEVVSYLIRTFSLSLRLFANMMAGHTLLQILSSFVVAFLSVSGLISFLAIVPFALVFAVTLLEVGIAFLQAYVFTILLAIYANDSINLH